MASRASGAALVSAALVAAALMALAPPPGLPLSGDTCEVDSVAGSDRYDSVFRAAAHTHFADSVRRDWCELKARAYVESTYREDAVSDAGAIGYLQIMPETAADFGVPAADLYDARINIHLAARIANHYWIFWSTPRPVDQHRLLERASYVAGPGNIMEAQELCGMPRDWADIRECLPDVTGRHAAVTSDYVDRIGRIKSEAEGGR